MYIAYVCLYTYIYIYILYSEVMTTVFFIHHNGFVATCRLWTAGGGVHALLVLEPTERSTSTKQGA